MIVIDDEVIPPFVVVAVIVRGIVKRSWFLLAACTDDVDVGIFKHLVAFVFRKILCLAALQNGCEETISVFYTANTTKEGNTNLGELKAFQEGEVQGTEVDHPNLPVSPQQPVFSFADV